MEVYSVLDRNVYVSIYPPTSIHTYMSDYSIILTSVVFHYSMFSSRLV